MNFLIINAEGQPVYLQNGLPDNFHPGPVHSHAAMAEGGFGLVVLQEKKSKFASGRFHFFRLLKNIFVRHLRPRNFLQTIVSLEGDILYQFKGYGQLLLRKGEYILFPSGAPAPEAELKPHQEYRVFEAVYSLDDLREPLSFFPYLNKLLFNERGEWLPAARAAGHQALDVIREMIQNPFKDEAIANYHYDDSLRRLLFLLVTQGTAAGEAALSDRELAFRVRDEITRDLSKDPRLPELARRFHVTAKRLRRSFKTVFGVNPSGFLREQRMQTALTWLRSTPKSVKEISLDLGFRSQQNFATRFKSRYGITPLEARYGVEGRAC